MAGLFTTSVLLFATFSSVFDDAHALRLPFAKRAASSNSTEPPLMTLPMPLHFDSNGRYAVQVAMGRTNPQNFNFSISTGSGLTFAAAQSCSNCANTPLYNQGASSSAVSLNGNDNTTWFGTTTSGALFKEDCGARLANGSNWSYLNQTCVAVNTQTSSFLSNGVSGIFGLGTNGGATGRSQSGVGFGDSIYGQWLPRNPNRANFTFGMMLLPPQASAQAGQSAGELHWTKPDESFFNPNQVSFKTVADTSAAASNQNNTALNTGQDWTVGLDGWIATVGSTHLSNTDTVVAVVDPLYPNIYLPGDQAKLIHDAINGSKVSNNGSTLGGLSQAYSIPCNAQYSFGLLVGAQTFVLNPERIILPQSDGTCLSAIEGFTDPALTQYLVGARFISTIYLIFNIPRDGPPTLGFSPRAFPSKSSTNVGAIVGGTVGGVAFVIICGLAAFWFLRRRADRRLGPFEIEDADKPVQHEGVEPYMVGAPTPAQPSLAPSMPMPTQPLLLGEESAGPLPPPSYEEASSSAGSPISPRPLPIRDLKTRVRVPSMSMITESSSNAM